MPVLSRYQKYIYLDFNEKLNYLIFEKLSHHVQILIGDSLTCGEFNTVFRFEISLIFAEKNALPNRFVRDVFFAE